MVLRAPDLLSQHLARVPPFRALMRTLEHRLFAQHDLIHPVLDIGCGDGHFAALAFPGGIDVGIDLQESIAVEARRNGSYTWVAVASGTALPFAEGSFRTVVSNCAIEHVPDIESLLREVSRVLPQGGQFIFTVPNERFTACLGAVSTLTKMGLRGWAARYGRWWNRRAEHHHLDAPETWRRRLVRVGLVVDVELSYMSPEATRVFELSHYYAVPSFVLHKLTRGGSTSAERARASFAYRWLKPYAEENLPDVGVATFYAAHKKGREAGSPLLGSCSADTSCRRRL
jgi:SAM-dependent methyltransferase